MKRTVTKSWSVEEVRDALKAYFKLPDDADVSFLTNIEYDSGDWQGRIPRRVVTGFEATFEEK